MKKLLKLRMNTCNTVNWDKGLFRAAIVLSVPALGWGLSQWTTDMQVVAKLIAVAGPVVLVWTVFVAVKFVGRGFTLDF